MGSGAGKVKRREPTTQYLAEELGGKWRYDRNARQWYCDDGIRYVCKVLTGQDFEGDYTGEYELYVYYLDGSKGGESVGYAAAMCRSAQMTKPDAGKGVE